MARKAAQLKSRTSAKKTAKKTETRPPVFQGWATTDADEVERRRWRGRTEIAAIERLDPDAGFYGNFRVRSYSGGSYEVEIRSLTDPENTCGCRDFATNGLGTCKHIEGVLHRLRHRNRRAFAAAAKEGYGKIEVYVPRGDGNIRVTWPKAEASRALCRKIVSHAEALRDGHDNALVALRGLAAEHPEKLRVSRYLDGWLEERRRAARRIEEREKFRADAAADPALLEVVKHPLLPYQVDGMVHLAFGERALLADDMGLGKTVQAIAACELLRRRRGIARVLVVSPASLKAEWQEQIARFTDLPAGIVRGRRAERLAQYRDPAFFTLANYEQILPDGPDINRLLKPEIVILDEAQRIKNWQTKTARAVKGLHSPYAFVLTGTPLENRIDEIYSVVQFLDPKLLGPLFRFNRDYYVLDERGRPEDYKNLDKLHERLKPVMLRRRKEDVETQLPGRTVSNYFAAMTPEQRLRYEDHEIRAQRLLSLARKRPLRREEFDRLQRFLACMRMTCDTPFILDPDNRDCPKLDELERILADLLAERPERKILIFSEWVRMLDLVSERAREMGLEFALHTGSVPQDRRRAEIHRFKKDPACRLFLSSDAGATGLNLQAADTVINLDLPWNPAKLEQRIARAWRKFQTRPVSIVNLVAEDSIEHRMLYLLEQKQALAEGVLDGRGDVKNIRMPTGRAAFVERMEAMMAGEGAGTDRAEAADPAETLRDTLLERHGDRLLSLASRGENGAPVFVVALDLPPAELEAEHRRLKESAPSRVEILDAHAFAALCRLEASGAIRFTGDTGTELYRSPLLDHGRAVRLHEARDLAGNADRQLRMATLLAGGGFEAEARAPALEALKLALRALVLASGKADPGENADSEAITADLADNDSLPRDVLRGVEEAHSRHATSPALQLAEDLLTRVRNALGPLTDRPGAPACRTNGTDAPAGSGLIAPMLHESRAAHALS
ncbi:MAG: SNF2-related protein [Alphaproteobacteria bacterium]